MRCQVVATDIGIIRQPNVTPSTAEKFRQRFQVFLQLRFGASRRWIRGS
jgi:hypothetical protein